MHKSVLACCVALTLGACASSKPTGEGYPYAKPADFVEYKFEHTSDVVHVPSDYETALWTPNQDKKPSGDWVVTEWRKVTIMEPRIYRGEGQVEGQPQEGPVVTTIEVPIRKMEKVVYFDFDSHALKGSAKATLKALPLREADGYFIDAHADSIGTDPYNQALSSRRATAVRKWLIAQGVPAEQIEVAASGEKKPVAPNTDSQGRALNRRAVIVLKLKPDTATAATSTSAEAGAVAPAAPLEGTEAAPPTTEPAKSEDGV